jgi:hypothetical protein
MAEIFQKQTKLRKAKLVKPPNLLKKKVGNGGFDPAVLKKAQAALDENTVDFKPLAVDLIQILNETVGIIKSGSVTGEAAIESLIYPAMQLKAQGSLFHYPLITDIANVLVNFLETIVTADKDALNIVTAHKASLNIVLAKEIREKDGAIGKNLCAELIDACNRYHKARKA